MLQRILGVLVEHTPPLVGKGDVLSWKHMYFSWKNMWLWKPLPSLNKDLRYKEMSSKAASRLCILYRYSGSKNDLTHWWKWLRRDKAANRGFSGALQTSSLHHELCAIGYQKVNGEHPWVHVSCRWLLKKKPITWRIVTGGSRTEVS